MTYNMWEFDTTVTERGSAYVSVKYMHLLFSWCGYKQSSPSPDLAREARRISIKRTFDFFMPVKKYIYGFAITGLVLGILGTCLGIYVLWVRYSQTYVSHKKLTPHTHITQIPHHFTNERFAPRCITRSTWKQTRQRFNMSWSQTFGRLSLQCKSYLQETHWLFCPCLYTSGNPVWRMSSLQTLLFLIWWWL